MKSYREKLLAEDGLQCVFPVWKMKSIEVVNEFLAAGFKAIVVCINSIHLNKSFCGRMLDESFINDLPASVDAAGENGEYHSFVFDGPIFSKPVTFKRREVVYKEYASPKKDDSSTAPQPPNGFYFQDLIMP